MSFEILSRQTYDVLRDVLTPVTHNKMLNQKFRTLS